VGRHSLEHFLREAERCVPHLGPDEQWRWAKDTHKKHPGITEHHITGKHAPRRADPDSVRLIPDECRYAAAPRDRWRGWFRGAVLLALLFLCARQARCQDPAGFNGGNDPAVRNVPLLWVINAPSGACAGQSIQYTFSANPPALYGCNQGTGDWTSLTSSSSGTVTSVGGNNGLTASPSPITSTGTLGLASIAAGGMLCNTTSGSAAPTVANCGITVPQSVTGITAVSASSPLVLNATTGNLTCSTCATTTNGGPLSGSSPITVSAAGAIGCATCTTTSTTFSLARGFGAVFDGGGSALTAGSTANVLTSVPYACTISAWSVMVDTGTASFDIWANTGTSIPTSSNSITDTAYPAIASGTSTGKNTTLMGWTTSITAFENIIVNLEAVSSATKATLIVECDQTVTL
jgi:hypothetical protein